MNYNWDWMIFFQESAYGAGSGNYLEMLLVGLLWTIATAVCGALIALVLGIPIGICRTLPSKRIKRLTNAYIEIIRNIPLLVQLFLWFFVFPELLPKVAGDWVKSLIHGPFYTALICLGFYHSIRVALIFSSAIDSLPAGQRAAGQALGLTTPQVYRYVLVPGAYRITLPPLGSESLNIIKNSAVAMTIGLRELTGSAQSMSEFTFQIFEAFAAATVLYLCLNLVVLSLIRLLERRARIPGYSMSGNNSSPKG